MPRPAAPNSHPNTQTHTHTQMNSMNTTKPDYETAREELRALYAQHCPQATIASHGRRRDAYGWEHNAFTVTIAGQSFKWRSGLGIKGEPDPAEVLACTCREARDAGQSFADWCSEYGYDADSINAFKAYMACQKQMAPALAVLRSRSLVNKFADLSCRL